MDAMFSPEFRCRRTGIEFSQNPDDLPLGESALAHVSLLAGLYARELTVSVGPNPRLQVAPNSDAKENGALKNRTPMFLLPETYSLAASQ